MKEANGFVNPLLPGIPNLRKRKRQTSESNSQTGGGQSYRLASKQTSGAYYYPTIYDQLSNIKLTRRALKEFDRRNNLSAKPLTPTAPALVEDPTENLPTRCGETSIELQRFARTGGPDLSDLKGFPQPAIVIMGGAGSGRRASQASSQSSSKRKRGENGSGASTTTVSPYSENSVTLLEEHNIHTFDHDDEPSNLQELMTMLESPRPTLTKATFSKQDFTRLCKAIKDAQSENKVLSDVIPYFTGETDYDNIMNQQCTNWAPLWDGSPLTLAQPDHADGIPIIGTGATYMLLRNQLDKFIVPILGQPFLPNFFLEYKRPKANREVAARQALLNATLGARGMAHVRTLNREDNTDQKACTFSATFASGTLALYAHFLKQPNKPGEEWHYHMCPLRSFSISDVVETYLGAATAFRNLREHAAKVRTELASAAALKLQEMKRTDRLPPKPKYPLTAEELAVAEQRKMALLQVEDVSSDELARNTPPPPNTSSGNKKARRR